MDSTIATTTVTEATDETGFIEYKIAHGIMLYGYSALLLLGTIGNVLSLLVLRCKSFKKSSGSVRLSMLVLLHLSVLYVVILRLWIRAVFGIDVRSTSSIGCKLHIFLTYFTGHAMSWALVLIVVERALVVTLHMAFKQYATGRNVVLVWASVLLLLAILDCHFFFTHDLIPDPTHYHIMPADATQSLQFLNSTAYPSANSSVEYALVCFRKQQHSHFNDFVWTYIDIMALIVVPFVIIFVANLVILMVVRWALEFQASNSNRRSNHDGSNRRASAANSTYMFLASSVIFLLLALPSGIFFIVISFNLEADDSPEAMAKGWLAYAVTGFLFHLVTALNFPVYYFSGSKFRKSCKECFSTNIFKSEASPLDTTRTHLSKHLL